MERSGGFTEGDTERTRGNGRRTTAEQRRRKEAAIKDKSRISRKESTDISLLSSQQEVDKY